MSTLRFSHSIWLSHIPTFCHVLKIVFLPFPFPNTGSDESRRVGGGGREGRVSFSLLSCVDIVHIWPKNRLIKVVNKSAQKGSLKNRSNGFSLSVMVSFTRNTTSERGTCTHMYNYVPYVGWPFAIEFNSLHQQIEKNWKENKRIVIIHNKRCNLAKRIAQKKASHTARRWIIL